MSVSNVTVSAAGVSRMTVMNGIPRLLNGYGALREALDTVELAGDSSPGTLSAPGLADFSESNSETFSGVGRRLARESRALQTAFQSSDLAGTRRAILALRQVLQSQSAMDFSVSAEEGVGGVETGVVSPAGQGGAGEKDAGSPRESKGQSPDAFGSEAGESPS
jgi:hypothetical protein